MSAKFEHCNVGSCYSDLSETAPATTDSGCIRAFANRFRGKCLIFHFTSIFAMNPGALPGGSDVAISKVTS